MEIKDGQGKVISTKDVMKYMRNKHFFIDPFQLTISQWCYIHGKNTMDSAREWLASEDGISEYNFLEMERSYWRYLSVWEKDEWNELKQKT